MTRKGFRKPFRAVPLRGRDGKIIPFTRPGKGGKGSGAGPGRRRGPWWKGVQPLWFVLPLAVFALVLLWDGGPFAAPRPTETDKEAARFTRCFGQVRQTCVIDGDTIWYRGEKIRLLNINAPETGNPACAAEAELGAAATLRLVELLNQGPFTLSRDPLEADRDPYGRALRRLTREGEDLGLMLVREGLAEEWKGYRGDWC